MFKRIIGIDPAIKSKHTATVLDSNAKIVRQNFKFEPTKQDFDKVLEIAKIDDGISYDEICIVCEPTSLVWVPIATYFFTLGCTVYMIKPEKAAALRKYLKKFTKTDSIDSMTLAKMPFIDLENLYALSLRSSDYIALERYCKQRDKFVSLTRAPKTRIRSIFQLVNPGALNAFADPFSGAGRKFLRNYINPHKIIKSGLKRLSRVLNKASRGQTALKVSEKLISNSKQSVELYSKAASRDLLPFDYEQLQFEVSNELDTLEYAEKKIALLDSKIKDLYLKLDPDKTLTGLQGIGINSAAIILSITGDPNRFSNVRKYKAFAATVPKTKATSNTNYLGLQISQGSHPLLRKTFYMIAETARHWDVDFAKKYYESVVIKQMHHKQAICILANMAAARVYSLLKRNAHSVSDNTIAYELRDADGKSIEKDEAYKIIQEDYKVPKQLRKSTKNNKKRGKSNLQFNTRQSLNSSKLTVAFPSVC